MEKRHNIYGGAVLVLAILTCMAALKLSGVGFFDRVELCYYALLGALAVAVVFYFETSIGMYAWPMVRMELIWPLGLISVWASFHEVLQIKGTLEPELDILGFPIVSGFEPQAWYASSLVFWLGVMAILAYGYIGDRMLFAKE
jgi:hypothetical protein